MENGGGRSFLRQLSSGGKQAWENTSGYHPLSNGGGVSRKWGKGKRGDVNGGVDSMKKTEEGGNGVENNNNNKKKKKVMVVIEENSKKGKHAMMWALTHVVNKGDMLVLLHVVPSYHNGAQKSEDDFQVSNSLVSLCKSSNPEVEVESVVIKGPKLGSVLSQVKKMEISILVLSQSKASPFCCLFKNSNEEFVDQCINQAECLTMAVRKQSKGMGGYLVSTRWHKNFWLLA
ncbi:Adenine nucleotide alpha hydrolases-like protein [Dioscorea alata]|uniref:Adenine nucleotide alpha hydrolases-like protein n=1 Tax=Dioscorea alata TaxID=55571 RepID=A0ACB7USI0_DIOAL|nr:Adenine nucleotide alpha hydrolases-like protein [Dioscorea alata]